MIFDHIRLVLLIRYARRRHFRNFILSQKLRFSIPAYYPVKNFYRYYQAFIARETGSIAKQTPGLPAELPSSYSVINELYKERIKGL